jgi:hypothetical protein
MRLLEIVRGAQTSDATILAGLALAKKLRKVGVVVGDGFGFVGNRMMLDGYFRESELMLLEGVAPERIDAVMENFGFAMGPHRVNDMAGVDVGTRVRTELTQRGLQPSEWGGETEYVDVPGKKPTRPKFSVGRGVTLMLGPPPTHDRFTTPCGTRESGVSKKMVPLRAPSDEGRQLTTSFEVPPPATVKVVGVSPIGGAYAKSA